MKILKIEVWNFCPEFTEGPYVMSHVVQEFAYGRILRITTDNDYSGLGEVVFPPSLPKSERLQAIADESSYFGSLVGQDIEDLLGFSDELIEKSKADRAVAFGLETAYFDIKAKYANQSLVGVLGGQRIEGVEDYFSISEETAEQIQARVKVAGDKRKVFQLKLGIGSLDDDTQLLQACLWAMNADQIVLADANGGWSVDDACEIFTRFDDPRITWEEPCPDYDLNVEVMKKSSVAVMVDQCVGNLQTAIRAINDGLASSVCIKPAFLGGLRMAQRVRDLCLEKNTMMRIDGPWCGDIANAAILHLAVGSTQEQIIASCDLREPLGIEPDLKGVRALEDGRIAPPKGLGLGVEILDSEMGLPESIFQ